MYIYIKILSCFTENKYFMDPLLRNSGWTNVNCCDIIAVPDKWEFPWVIHV